MPSLPRRLNVRIILTVSCVLLATGIASGWLTASSQTAGLLAAKRADSAVMARHFADSIARHLLVQDYAELEAFLRKSVDLPDILRLQVFEPDGSLVWDVERNGGKRPSARTGLGRTILPATPAQLIIADDDRLVIWEPVTAGDTLGWLKADFSLSTIREAQASTWKSMLVLVAAWVAITSLLIVLMLRPIVQSIARLSQFSKGLDQHKGEQIDIGAQPVEIAQLGASLNEASVKLLATERQLLDERERLRKSEEMYRTIFEESFDGLFITSPAGRILEINKKGVQILGYDSRDAVMKLDLARDVYAFPPDRKRILEMVEERGTAEYEVTVKRKDGSLIVTRCALTAVRNAGGATSSYRGIISDITARRRAEEEIRKLNQELEQRVADRTARLEAANKELEAFSYSVSHDLRSPLRHIAGFVGLLKDDAENVLSEDGRHCLDVISRATLQMEALIDDLLAFSRIGRSALSRTSVELGALVSEVIADAEPETRDRTVHWRIAADLPAVEGDRAMLKVAFSNLILNALKFTRVRREAEIEIGFQTDSDKETIVYVRDNGVGFDMKYADKLFGVFQRLHSANEFEGTGIGLANVRRVISRHGGRTWAEGQVDGGATFYFSIPRSPATTEAQS